MDLRSFWPLRDAAFLVSHLGKLPDNLLGDTSRRGELTAGHEAGGHRFSKGLSAMS